MRESARREGIPTTTVLNFRLNEMCAWQVVNREGSTGTFPHVRNGMKCAFIGVEKDKRDKK